MTAIRFDAAAAAVDFHLSIITHHMYICLCLFLFQVSVSISPTRSMFSVNIIIIKTQSDSGKISK